MWELWTGIALLLLAAVLIVFAYWPPQGKRPGAARGALDRMEFDPVKNAPPEAPGE